MRSKKIALHSWWLATSTRWHWTRLRPFPTQWAPTLHHARRRRKTKQTTRRKETRTNGSSTISSPHRTTAFHKVGWRRHPKQTPTGAPAATGKPTSQTQQAQTFAEYLRDSHWAEPSTSYTGPTDPIHPPAPVDLSPITTAELQTALKQLKHQAQTPSQPKPGKAGPTQPTSTPPCTQPVTSHSHSTGGLAHSHSRRDLQRQGSTHRPSELQTHITSQHVIQACCQDHSQQAAGGDRRQTQRHPVRVPSSTVHVTADPHHPSAYRESRSHRPPLYTILLD